MIPFKWKSEAHPLVPGAELLHLSEGLPHVFAGKSYLEHNQVLKFLSTHTFTLMEERPSALEGCPAQHRVMVTVPIGRYF